MDDLSTIASVLMGIDGSPSITGHPAVDVGIAKQLRNQLMPKELRINWCFFS